MTPSPRRIAVVSGKGGVGKTIISTNLSRLASDNQRVLLIDFDFPNQGLTGLLSDFLTTDCVSARELIESADSIDLTRIIAIREHLYFIPAFDPADTDRFLFTTNDFDVSCLVNMLDERLTVLAENCRCGLIIMDCHGGLDHISYAAFKASDYTIVVSEPDKVTFNGTLELFDYYLENFNSTHYHAQHQNPQPIEPPSELTLGYQNREFEKNNVIFVLNRVSGRFSYRQLLALYQRQLITNFPLIASIIKHYTLIPSDNLLARSFSEYPFYIELLPESIFVQKLALIYDYIFNSRPKIRGRSILYYIFEKKSKNGIKKYLKSNEERRSQAVFAFTSMVQVVFILLASATIHMNMVSNTAVLPSKAIVLFLQEHEVVFKFPPSPVRAG
jgi:MinD-like ATPase involved in chromosome partitioning or flagellar assembly